MGEVSTVFTGDSAQLEKVMHKLEQQNLKLIEQNRLLAQQSKQNSQAVVRGIDGAVSSLTKMAASYLSVNAAIQLVTASLKDQEEQQKKTQAATVTIAGAQMNMMQNIGDVTDAQQAEFIGKLKSINKRLTPAGGMKTVYNMASSALSSSGGDRERALDAIEQALRFAPDNPEAAEQIAGAVIDMSKATGSTSALENLGFLKYIGDQANVPDWGKISKNLTKGVIGATKQGATPQEALALVSAMTQGMPDKTGEQSSTAAIKFAKQLQEFLPTADRYTWEKKNGRDVRVLQTKGTGLKTLSERLAYMQQNPMARERFLRGGSFETASIAAVEQLLEGPDTMTGQYFTGAMKAANVPYSKMAESAYAKIQQMQKQFEQQTAKAQRTSEAAEERMRTETALGREAAVNASFTSEELQKQMSAAGLGWVERKMRAFEYRLDQFSTEEDKYTRSIEAVAGKIKRGMEKPELSTDEYLLEHYGETRGREKIRQRDLADRMLEDLAEKKRIAAEQREAAKREETPASNEGASLRAHADDRLLAATNDLRQTIQSELRALREDLRRPTNAAVQRGASRWQTA